MHSFEPMVAWLRTAKVLFHIVASKANPVLCCTTATKRADQPVFRANCFALPRWLWCNSNNFPKGGWPGVRWEHKVA